MPVRNLRDGSIRLRVDDNGAAAEGAVTIDLEEGDLAYVEKRPVHMLRDRGVLSHARPAADEHVELSFSMMYQSHSAHAATTPYDVLKNIGGAAAWLSQEALSDVWAIDVEFTIADPAGGSSEVLSFDRFVPDDGISFEEGEEFNKLTVSGKALKRSPFILPTDVPGLFGWWAADLIIGLSDADPVTTWDDASNHDNDLAQSVAGEKPTYQTNEINTSLPIIRFDGTDDNLFKTLAHTIPQPYTYFLIAKHVTGSVTADEHFIGGHDNAGLDSGQLTAKQSGTDQFAMNAGASADIDDLTGAFVILIAAFDGAASIARFNRTQTTESAGTRDLKKIVMGALGSELANFADIDVAEFAVFDRKLTVSQMRGLEDYAAWKYGL
ncbi:MAG: hypothetical protein V3T08_09515 [Gemmatimonadota bacterium]